MSELSPTANYPLLFETANQPLILLGTSSDRVFSPEGTRSYTITFGKSLPNSRISPYLSINYSSWERGFNFPFGVNFAVHPQCRRQMESDWVFCPACGFDTRPTMNRATVIGCSHRVFSQNVYCVDRGAQAGVSSVPRGTQGTAFLPTTSVPHQHISFSVGAPPTQNLKRLATRYADASRLFNITLLAGMFCLWPLWIVTSLEHVARLVNWLVHVYDR